MNRPGRAARVGDVLAGVLGDLGLGETLRAADVVAAWQRVVGEKLARVARAKSFQGGTLVVEAESPVWMQEIRFHQVHLRKRFDEECGPGVVREFRLILSDPREGESTWR
jgi:predicted nucleic acid-binding Zn ribbon protein